MIVLIIVIFPFVFIFILLPIIYHVFYKSTVIFTLFLYYQNILSTFLFLKIICFINKFKYLYLKKLLTSFTDGSFEETLMLLYLKSVINSLNNHKFKI